MAVETYGVVQIGGPIGTVGEAAEFVRRAREFGAHDDTVLVNGFLSVEFVGTPEPVAPGTAGDPVNAVMPLVAYAPDGN